MTKRLVSGRSASITRSSESAIWASMVSAVGLSTSSSVRRGTTTFTLLPSQNQQRRHLSQNGHAWLGSLRYGFPFAPQLGSFSLQYGKVSNEPEKTTDNVPADTKTSPQRRVKMMKRPQKDLSELDIDDDAGLKFSFSHSASIRGVKGDVRVADMIIARRQVATKALLRLKVLEMASCARGDVRALFRGLTKDFEREKQDVIDSFWAQIPEDNMNWEGAGAGGGGDVDDSVHPVAGTARFNSQRVLNDILAAIDSDHKSCGQREGEHLDRITEVEASLLEMLDGTEASTLPSSTCHLLRYLDSTRERVELIFSKKIDSVVQLFVLYHQKRKMHDAENRLHEESGIAAITNPAATPASMTISHNLFTPADTTSPNPNLVDNMSNVSNVSKVSGSSAPSSTEACRISYSATSKAIGKVKREEPRNDLADAPPLPSSKMSASDEEVLRSRITGEDLIRDQQRRIYCRSLQEEVDEVENRWAVRRLERDARWRALNERMTSSSSNAANPPPVPLVSGDAMTGSLFLSAAEELGVLDRSDWETTAMVAEHCGTEGSPRLSTTEEAEEEEDENGGRRGTSELDELVLQDALIYSRALVFASGGSRSARDWIAGAGTLSSSNPALVRIALQHHGTLRDLQMFVSLCEVTACTHTSITERVTAICEEAIASGDSAQSAACRRAQLASNSEDAVRVVCGSGMDGAAEILSPTSLLAEHIIFKEEQRAQQESEEAAAAAGGASYSSFTHISSLAEYHHRTNTNRHPTSGQGVNEVTPEGAGTTGGEDTHGGATSVAVHSTTAHEYFYAKTPYAGVSGTIGTSHTSSTSSVSGSGRRAAFARCFNAKQCAIISSQPLDLEFGDHSDFDPSPITATTTTTSSSRRQDSSEDEPLSVELPIPFTPHEQVNILKRCLVYDSLCAACFMQPQWSLRNTRTLNASCDAEEESAKSALSTLPGSVSVEEGHALEEESDSTIDMDEEDGEGVLESIQQEDDAKHSRIVYTNDEGGDSQNESRILGRHPSAMVRDDINPVIANSSSALSNEAATQSVIDAGESPSMHEDDFPADDAWMNHPLYVRYFGAAGSRIKVPAAVPNGSPAASSGMSYVPHGASTVGVGAANDRHVRRALACARRLDVDPEVVAELLSVVLEEESIVSAKQRVVGDLGGSAENSTAE